MAGQDLLAPLTPADRIWAVGAINGDAHGLQGIHRQLASRLGRGDRLVYLGNYFGDGDEVGRTIDEILLFRRAFIALPGVELSDIAFLRGAAEEIVSKLLQIHFAPNPGDVFDWMLDQGLAGTIRAYGARAEEARPIMRQGARGISAWTGRIRDAMRARDGHEALMAHLHHAAYTVDGKLLFVHAGLDPSRPLPNQSDSFWWDIRRFDRISTPYYDFVRLIRGSARHRTGLTETELTVTLDGGAGRGGTVLAAGIAPDGQLTEVLSGA